MNIEHRTPNIERRMIGALATRKDSTLDVRRSMFDV
jgi:hypothetical protein